MLNLLNSSFVPQACCWIFMFFWKTSWSNVSKWGESQETLIALQALPATCCVSLGNVLQILVPLFPTLFLYIRIVSGRNSLLRVHIALWFPFWAPGTKSKYFHIKYFSEQCCKPFIFYGGNPADCGCEPALIFALASVFEPFE